jgi:hypothetical protein
MRFGRLEESFRIFISIPRRIALAGSQRPSGRGDHPEGPRKV